MQIASAHRTRLQCQSLQRGLSLGKSTAVMRPRDGATPLAVNHTRQSSNLGGSGCTTLHTHAYVYRSLNILHFSMFPPRGKVAHLYARIGLQCIAFSLCPVLALCYDTGLYGSMVFLKLYAINLFFSVLNHYAHYKTYERTQKKV